MKKKPLSTRAIILIGFLGLLAFASIGFILSQSGNDSAPAQWFKVNFFPADAYGTISLMDVSSGDVASQEYKGSTPAAWIFSFFVALIAFLGCFIFFAKERRWF
jgi:hypothetical protein